jgi:formamidase
MKRIEIDRGKRLADQPSTGHNRFHPDIPPLLEVDEGEEVVLETRDGVDGQLAPAATEASVATMEAGAVHPLTGPVAVRGAQPGDVLEVEFLDIVPQPHAFTAIIPGLGFLRDIYTTPYLVHWQIDGGWATSAQLPGVRIPGAPFMGVSGLAPSPAQVRAWAKREQDLIDRGGLVFPPDATGAVPGRGPAASEGLRTVPPRTAAIWTSSSSRKDRSSCFPCLCRAPASRWATAILPRAMGRSVSPPWRWGPPWPSGSGS